MTDIRTVILMVEFLMEVPCRQVIPNATRRVDLDTRRQQLKELYHLLKDVVTYYRMICIKPAQQRAADLSKFFLEKMVFAGAANPSDRVVVGSMCCMMLQQVLGYGLAIDAPLLKYAEASDPLAYAIGVASSGYEAIPRGLSTQQLRSSRFGADARGPGSYYSVSTAAMNSRWSQPTTGRCYAGTLTTSPWKAEFWHALTHNRGLSHRERNKENDSRKNIVPGFEQKEMLARAAREEHFMPLPFISREPLAVGEMVHASLLWDGAQEEELLYAPLDQSDTLELEIDHDKLELRKESIQNLASAWTTSQRSLVPIVGNRFPMIFDKEANMASLYVIDTTSLVGYNLGSLMQRSKPLGISGFDDKKCLLYFPAKSGMPDISPISFVEHPLLQIVLCIPELPVESGHLVAMRRVFSASEAGGLPAMPQDLRSQRVQLNSLDVKDLLKPDGAVFDRVLPMRTTQGKLSDFSLLPEFETWYYPGHVTRHYETGRGVEKNEELWQTRWEQIEFSLGLAWSFELPTAKGDEGVVDSANDPTETDVLTVKREHSMASPTMESTDMDAYPDESWNDEDKPSTKRLPTPESNEIDAQSPETEDLSIESPANDLVAEEVTKDWNRERKPDKKHTWFANVKRMILGPSSMKETEEQQNDSIFLEEPVSEYNEKDGEAPSPCQNAISSPAPAFGSQLNTSNVEWNDETPVMGHEERNTTPASPPYHGKTAVDSNAFGHQAVDLNSPGLESTGAIIETVPEFPYSPQSVEPPVQKLPESPAPGTIASDSSTAMDTDEERDIDSLQVVNNASEKKSKKKLKKKKKKHHKRKKSSHVKNENAVPA